MIKRNIKPRKPLQSYLDQSSILSKTLEAPLVKKQLLILDLNGTLVSRLKPTTALYSRPYHDTFFDYIFEKFNVMVWSSAQPQNVNNMCRIFGKHRNELRLVWTRKDFGLSTKEYNSKTLTIKNLEFIWKKLPEFGPKNTILLDDSPEKTILQPYNHCVVSEFDHKSSDFKTRGDCELIVMKTYLEKLRYQDNVCNYIKNHPYVSSSTGTSDDPLIVPSTVCHHYVFPKDGTEPLPTSCDLGLDDDLDKLTSKVDNLKL